MSLKYIHKKTCQQVDRNYDYVVSEFHVHAGSYFIKVILFRCYVRYPDMFFVATNKNPVQPTAPDFLRGVDNLLLHSEAYSGCFAIYSKPQEVDSISDIREL